jgi:spermidine synthase
MRFDYKKLLLVMAFLSGFAALLYEIVWFGEMHLVFGVSSFALSTVLSVFFFGLVVGSYFGGRFVDRVLSRRKLFFVYAGVEILIAAFAFLVLFLLDLILPGLRVFYQIGLGFFGFSLMRFFAVVIVLIIPASLIGMTFPLLMKLYVRDRAEIRDAVGGIYFANTFGGVFGVLLTGIFFIKFFGVYGSLWIGVFANLIVALAAFFVGFRFRGAGHE